MNPTEAPPSPGWDAIDAALRPLYGARAPKHYGTILPYRLGGPDPIHGISAWYNEAPSPHWHFVTYGFTELWEKESEDPEVSGFGFELTFRLAVERETPEPPMWPLSLLQNFGRYVYRTGRYFEAGHHFDLNGPIALSEQTEIVAAAFAPDPKLPPAKGPFGRFEFLQVVGLHREELDALREWNTLGVLELLSRKDPLLVTRLDRPSLLSDPELGRELKERTAKEGSSTGSLFAPLASWSKSPWGQGYQVALSAVAVDGLKRLLGRRIPYGRALLVIGGEGASQKVAFDPSPSSGLEEREGVLHVLLTNEAADRLRAAVEAQRGEYRIPELSDLTLQVVPTEIEDHQGKVVRTIG